MKLKKLIYTALASLLVLPAFSVSPASSHATKSELTGRGFESYAENEFLDLLYDEENSVLAVIQKDSGYVWYSAPEGWEDDEEASGFVLNSMPSFLTVRAKDQNSTFRNANSYINSFVRRGLWPKAITNGIRLEHEFPRDGFFIPLEITIEGNSLLMSVPVWEIQENMDDGMDYDEEIKTTLDLLDLQINPYFGAAGKDEEGFIFVPDGSGAIMSFNNRKSGSTYEQYVYGRDRSIVATRRKNVYQDIRLPVFGMSKEDAAFIAVIEGSESRAMISADVAQQTSYNSVGASFILRDFDSMSFRERTGTPRDIVIYEKVNFAESKERYSVRYIFLDEEKNNLAGMADAYRTYLQDKKGFTKKTDSSKPALTIDFVGSSNKKRTIVGLPMNVGVAYTKFSDIEDTLETLKAQGVKDFNVKLEGWVKGGVLGKYPSSAKPNGILGGNHGFKKLSSYLNENNVPLYASADFVNLYNTADLAHIKEVSANRMINRSPVKIPDYRMSTYTDEKVSDKYPSYVLREKVVEKGFTKFFGQLNKKYAKVGFAPDSMGNLASSDFGPDGLRRQAVADKFAGLLKNASSRKPIMLSSPNAYALPSATYVSDLPSTSSQFDVEDTAVPFYQMVLKGYVPFSNLPANRSTNLEDYKLKLLETGADVSFLWITRNSDLVRDSRMQSYMNLYSEDWMEDAVELYKEVSAVTSKVAGCSIVDYQIDGDLRSTTYSNGVTVTVNYADKTYSVTEGSAK